MNATSEVPQSILDDYYGDTSHVSRSMLEDFIKSPALYHGRYVTKTIPPIAETDTMRFGSAVHSKLFGGPMVVKAPKCDRRTKEGKAAWEFFQTSLSEAPSIVLDEESHGRLDVVVEKVKDNPIAAEILSGVEELEILSGAVEREIICCRRHSTGLDLKSKLDAKSIWNDRRFIVDLKTSSDPYPDSWPRVMPRYGYHRQAAFYGDADPEADWVWIVVGNEPPHDVFVYLASHFAISAGRSENETALQRLADCLKSGKWIHPQSEQVNRASLPQWYVEKETDNVRCDW